MSENKTKKRRGKAGRRVRKWIKWLLVLAVLLAAGLFGLKAYIRVQAEKAGEAESYSRATVTRGAMSDTVYGTGTTSARNQPNLLAEADGTLTELRMDIGDEVREGDILAVLVNEEIDDTITDLEFAIWDLDDTIRGTAAGSKVTHIESPVAGRVAAIYAKANDDALAVFRREGALAVISTDERMKVELQSKDSILGLTLDERVTVVGDHIYAEGTVVDLTRQGTAATITIHEDDLPVAKDFDGDGQNDPIMGMTVSVRNADDAEVGTGVLEPNKPIAVSSYGGTISSVRTKIGAQVKRGTTLFYVEDSPLTLAIEDLRLQRETSAKELADAKELRENLIVVAPCDGTIASVDVAEGDEITSGTLLGSILHGEDMNLTIAVDELDVVEVEPGQKVSITIDALSGLNLTGEVFKIAPVGTNSGGVTTYDVELTFDAAGTGVRSGMNATGEIEIASAENTLYIPVEALMTINNQTYVMVADGGTTALSDAAASRSAGQRGQRGQRQAGDAQAAAGAPGAAGEDETDEAAAEGSVADKAKALYAKARARLMAWLYEGVETNTAEQQTGTLQQVEIGMQNDDYAEILSGLSEGDVVLYTGGEEEAATMFGGSRGGMPGMNMGGMGGRPTGR